MTADTQQDEIRPPEGLVTAYGTTRPTRFRSSGLVFLLALVLMVMAAPFIQSHHYGALIQVSSYTAVLLAGVWTIGRSKRTLVIAATLIVPATAIKWIEYLWRGLLPDGVAAAAAMVPVAFIIGVLFRLVLSAGRVDSNVLCAAVSNYLMIGVFWAFGYVLVDALVPNAFAFPEGRVGTMGLKQQFTPFYFSMVTLCTVGYGDIAPAAPVARMVAVLEGMVGTFYMAILIARLVAMYSFGPRNGSGAPEKR